MDFTKYAEIENSYRIKFVNEIIDHGLSFGDWSISEKLHGANFSVWMNHEGMRFAKRTAFLGLTDNFYNFQSVVDTYDQNFRFLYEMIRQTHQIDSEKLTVVLYGEIFGGSYPHSDVPREPTATSVQKGIYYCPHNDFYAFDLKIDGRYVNVNIFEEMMKECGLLYAKTLFKGSFKEALAYPNAFPTKIPSEWGLPPIENNICEGVVIKPTDTRFLPSGHRVILKNKNEHFTEKSHKPQKIKELVSFELTEEETRLFDLACGMICENRLRNVLSKMGQVTDKMFGQIQGLFMKDIMEELRKDELDKLEALELKRRKNLQDEINKQARSFVRERIQNIIDGTF